MDFDSSGKEGFKLRQGDLFEALIMQTMSNTTINIEILRRITEVQHKLNNDIIDDKVVSDELNIFLEYARNSSEKAKNDLIAKLYVKNEDE